MRSARPRQTPARQRSTLTASKAGYDLDAHYISYRFDDEEDESQEGGSSSSNEEEENIININNDNFNINNDIQINSEKNNHKSRKIEVIENYFDFHMHDIDLLQIESYYKTYKDISQEDSKLIKLILSKYNKFISENLNQTTYPYLINSIKPHFQILETNLTEVKSFPLNLLSVLLMLNI